MGNKEFKGVNPVLQIKDTLDTMSNDQYDNYKSSEAFAAWCAQQGFDEVPDDRCAAEQILDELTEEQVARFWCERSGIPYLGRADIGHDSDNRVVPFG